MHTDTPSPEGAALEKKRKLEWDWRTVSGIREDERIKELLFEVHGSGPFRTGDGTMNYDIC